MAFVAVDSGNIRDSVVIGTLNVNAPLPDPLRPHVAYDAMHDSGEVDAQGDCHPGTRIAIQEIIKRWAKNPRPNTLVNLMIGAAGAGKSAIMRTIAKVLEEEGKLFGGFFCFRSSTRRSDGSLVIPTLVAQLVKRIPGLRPLVNQAFEEDEGLLTKAMDFQALKLIVEPLNSIDPNERAQWPYVVLLDGLDEINGVAAQQAIVRIFAYINRHLVSPLHVLVASRPEPPILQAFDEFLDGSWTRLELDESLNPNDDIDTLYLDHFQRICDRNPHLPLGWPGVPVRRILVAKGSGQFIFASVVVGVVGDPSSPLSPQERLDLVLEVTKRDDLRPLERLDLLYVTVLNQIPETVRSQVLCILAVILAAGNTLNGLFPSPRFLDALFCVPSGTTRHRLCHLHSILTIPLDDDDKIAPQHATLGDFVFDRARSEQFGFHVDKTQLVEDTVVQIATALLSNPEPISGTFHDFFDFFDTQMEELGRGSLPLELAKKLQSYDPSSMSPLALTLFVAPLACMMKSSWKYRSFRNLSRSIIQEAHRRARLYCDNYGRLGATFLALFAVGACSAEVDAPTWDAIGLRLPTKVKKSNILSMDKTSGLSLMAYMDTAMDWVSSWRRALARNGWLCSYLHFLTRRDVVQSFTEFATELSADTWWRCLPFDRSAVSSLRVILSSARPERDDEYLTSRFLDHIAYYIDRHWKRCWRVPSIYLLRQDWNRWKVDYERARSLKMCKGIRMRCLEAESEDEGGGEWDSGD